MSTIVTRSGKGSPLTNTELDANFTNLNSDKLQLSDLSAGTGISLSAGGAIANTAPDQTVALTGAGTTSVSGTYPNFTITGAGTTYTAGSGLSLTGTEFANTAPDQTVALTAGGATSISGTYPNFTISSVNTTYNVGDGGLTEINFTSADHTKLNGIATGATNVTNNNQLTNGAGYVTANTTYTAGSGLSLTGTVFANTSPDQTVALTGAGATSISGTYPNFTITSANTTYNVGNGGLTEINFTSALSSKLGNIEASADVTDTANVTTAGALMDSEVTNLAQVKAFDSSDYATAAQGTLAAAALPKSGGAMTGAITTNSTFDGVDIATRDGVLTTTTNTANAALPKAGGTMSGAIAMGTNKITGAGDPTV